MGLTPLMGASLMGFRESAALLLERGADPNKQTEVSSLHTFINTVHNHAKVPNYGRMARLLFYSPVGMAKRSWSSCYWGIRPLMSISPIRLACCICLLSASLCRYIRYVPSYDYTIEWLYCPTRRLYEERRAYSGVTCAQSEGY